MEKNTTLGLFLSLKPSLLMMKTSPERETAGPMATVHEEDETDLAEVPRLRTRRRSSMSDLDKMKRPKGQEAQERKLGLSGPEVLTGSIGDLMNLPRYHQPCSRLESSSMDSLIARSVPLSYVTPTKLSPRNASPTNPTAAAAAAVAATISTPTTRRPRERSTLTCTQRTERFSRLLGRQKAIVPNMSFVRVRTMVSTYRVVHLSRNSALKKYY
ncbi:uncharacterized protein LOC124365825 [Homalodisca vitripennis]|uniref:uncharacterized protein LOC124365825 n=1 Tax=Homalodisca vitripennis TaxID=197043 RepID=UPI001EEB81CD|nr:uncharacterized protein LOC124365825 [Homalodisca vitripennis]